MNTMTYKGYLGSVAFSEKDNVFYGIEPDKSYSGVLNVRLTPAIHRKIAMLAFQSGLTLNAYIKDALEKAVEAEVTL